MTTDTHDTAAALEAAIVSATTDQTRADAGGHNAIGAALLRAAITAHVEAEVARRLAAAPDVEEAIATLRRLTFDAAITGITIGGVNETTDRLRAAIAADKARAVAAAISPAVHELRNALPPVRHHAQRIEPGDRREAILRGIDRALAVADELAAVLDGGPAVKARPTPDEARRLVDALESRAAIAAGYMADYDESELDTARTALLRALGVEA